LAFVLGALPKNNAARDRASGIRYVFAI